MIPANLTASKLISCGGSWFTLLASTTPEATVAWAALNSRGYTSKGKGDGKGEATGKDHHAEGKALYDAFLASASQRSGAGVVRKTGKQTADGQAGALRTWLRASHAEVIAIKRGATNPALAGLPTLGEVTTTSGLLLSTQDFLAFLSDKGVQAALAPYHIGAAEVAEGKQLLAAWEKARGTLSAARGSETNIQRSNIGAREAFAEWLGTWWGIARVRLADQPGVLEALGVAGKARRKKRNGELAPQNVAGKVGEG
ncbi:MAG: hypothetical protein HY902_06935 [Deltaproteobacteria bacterium]|nr:hypothetical protein [Deltaproteobacteria bacterium]